MSLSCHKQSSPGKATGATNFHTIVGFVETVHPRARQLLHPGLAPARTCLLGALTRPGNSQARPSWGSAPAAPGTCRWGRGCGASQPLAVLLGRDRRGRGAMAPSAGGRRGGGAGRGCARSGPVRSGPARSLRRPRGGGGAAPARRRWGARGEVKTGGLSRWRVASAGAAAAAVPGRVLHAVSLSRAEVAAPCGSALRNAAVQTCNCPRSVTARALVGRWRKRSHPAVFGSSCCTDTVCQLCSPGTENGA